MLLAATGRPRGGPQCWSGVTTRPMLRPAVLSEGTTPGPRNPPMA
jgi:hypothetical protein